MAQFSGMLSTVGTTSFLNGTLLVSGGDPSRATALLQARGCSSQHLAVVAGRSVMIGTTPAIEMTGAQCTGIQATVTQLRSAARRGTKKFSIKMAGKKGSK